VGRDSFQISFEEEILNTPLFLDEIFLQLPPFLKNLTALFKEKRERDIFLISTLGVLSGSMSEVTGRYHRGTHFTHLYVFILGPAASGKGVMNFAKKLIDPYAKHLAKDNEEFILEYRKEKIKYEQQLNAYLKSQKGSLPEEPIFPKTPRLFLPANSSTAMLKKLLYHSDGRGVMFETEADTLSNTLKFDWGNFSETLRKNFHSEWDASGRMNESDYIEIETSRFAVVLSGTPNQIFRLIPSVEDGLFSRFSFYIFNTKTKWLDVSPEGNNRTIESQFESASLEMREMLLHLEKFPTEIRLKPEQWNELNSFFSPLLEETNIFYGSITKSVVVRLGVISFRIMMILTALRKAEAKNEGVEVFCKDEDFKSALAIVQVLLKHALTLVKRLPDANAVKFNKMPENKKEFFEVLPNKFRRKKAIEIGKHFNLSRSAVDRLLADLPNNYLKKTSYGIYEKIKNNNIPNREK